MALLLVLNWKDLTRMGKFSCASLAGVRERTLPKQSPLFFSMLCPFGAPCYEFYLMAAILYQPMD